jgi:AcrR family transcriptional regulator
VARLTREQSQALTREKLLRSASEVVGRDGYEGASVERIAEEAGYSKGAFYSNFSSKEDVLLQLLEGHAGNDVTDLTELLHDITDPEEVIEAVARWSDERSADQKWGIIAIEFLRRARRDGTLDERHRHLFVSQWEEIGSLLMAKLQLDASTVSAVDLGGIVLELSYGGISGYLNVNTAGQMVRHILQATCASSRLAHAG